MTTTVDRDKHSAGAAQDTDSAHKRDSGESGKTSDSIKKTHTSVSEMASLQESVAHHVLDAIVTTIGGSEREGQKTMVDHVCQAFNEESAAIIQAGTGTGKSFAYLVPAALWAAENSTQVVVSTATLALQKQLIDHDIPLVAKIIKREQGATVSYQTLKGWRNYVCLHKIRSKTVAPSLFDDVDMPEAIDDDLAATGLGKQVNRIRVWAEKTRTGERDELTPAVSAKAWSHASIDSRECIGDTCPFVDECFPKKARLKASVADIVVTNHAMVGIQTMTPSAVLPSFDAIIVDEAHELVRSVRDQATFVISVKMMAALVKGVERYLDIDTSACTSAITSYSRVIDAYVEQLFEEVPHDIVTALSGLRSAFRALLSEVKTEAEADDSPPLARQAEVEIEDLLDHIRDTIEATCQTHGVWIRVDSEQNRILTVAPLQVGSHIHNGLFEERPAVLTSATLQVNKSFDHIASDVGLIDYMSDDVGSPFNYSQQAILYAAAHLSRPGRGGIAEDALKELLKLVEASDGGALCLFSSHLAVEQAVEYLKSHSDRAVFFQEKGKGTQGVEDFRKDPHSVLCATMSLWQGIDLPGLGCRLVVIDRIPFARPDDPLMKALERDASSRGGNGFFHVALPAAALKLAQGAGRLIRRDDDKGVVAILDSRFVLTKSYSSYLVRSLPPMWKTVDSDLVCAALKRLSELVE